MERTSNGREILGICSDGSSLHAYRLNPVSKVAIRLAGIAFIPVSSKVSLYAVHLADSLGSLFPPGGATFPFSPCTSSTELPLSTRHPALGA